VPRLLGSVPKRFPFLSDWLQLFAPLLLERARFFSQDPELFRLLPRGFGQHAVSFGTVTLLVGLLPNIFRVFPSLLGVHTIRLRLRPVVRHMASLRSHECVNSYDGA
jgi:hypothetical protein